MAASITVARPGPIPASAGIGLRAPHYRALLETRPAVGWLEVHSENYFGEGGAPLAWLERLREHYPLSLHGVGLSLGTTDPLSAAHLAKLGRLVERFEPALVSEHVSWGAVGGRWFNDLFPLPYTEESLAHLSDRVMQVQDRLGRELLVENVSSYLRYVHSTIPEWEFLAELARRSGCGLLLDVNNVYVSARNLGFDAREYLRSIPASAVREVHLAGFVVNRVDDGEVLVDSHSRPVHPPVWALYAEALDRLGPVPTLIEWDSDIPPLETLVAEAEKAEALLEARHVRAA
jgi:hypothetical protein